MALKGGFTVLSKASCSSAVKKQKWCHSITTYLTSAALDGQRETYAAANAQRGEALSRVATDHFVEQRGQDTRAAGTDQVADYKRRLGPVAV